MATLDELTTPLTKDEVRDSVYAGIEARGTRTTSWKEGAIARTIVAAVAIVGSAFSRLQASIAKGGFLELAEKEWLTLVARYVFGVERDTGTFATGEVTLTNTAGGVFVVGVGDLIVLNGTTGKSYRNTAAFTLDALETEIVPVQALELGTDSNAAAGEIDDFVTPLLDVTVNNAEALIGTDVEEDEPLRIRCRAKTGVASPNGPRDAYAYVALSAVRSDGSVIGVTRVRTVPDGVGGVDVYVATATGEITGDAGDPETDLGAVADAIHRLAEPLAITPNVQSATGVTVNVTYEAWFLDTAGLTEIGVAQLIDAKLEDFIASQPIGGNYITPGPPPGYLYLEGLKPVISGILPGLQIDLELTSPAADVPFAINEAPNLGTVTGTVHFVTGQVS